MDLRTSDVLPTEVCWAKKKVLITLEEMYNMFIEQT